MSDTPHAPWNLAGECIVAWTRPPRGVAALIPAGIHPFAGLAALVAVRYFDSPVGPYLELSLAVPARIGLRPGLCVVFQAVSSADARLAYRRNWGLPAVVRQLSWTEAGDDARDSGARVLRCKEPGIEVRGAPVGPAWPAWLPMRSVQRRADGPVLLPRQLVGRARFARTLVTVDDAVDPMIGALAGRHPGLMVAGMRVVAAPARHPLGLWSSLRAPLSAPEPAMTNARSLRAARAAQPTAASTADAATTQPAADAARADRLETVATTNHSHSSNDQNRPLGPAVYSGAPHGRLAQLVRAQPSHG